MRKYAISALFALLIAQPTFAAVSDASSSDSDDQSFKQCETIVNACQSAGFERSGGPGKAFWHDCMKPILLGQTVNGVNVDSKDAIACRKFKIEKMQKELKELQKAKAK